MQRHISNQTFLLATIFTLLVSVQAYSQCTSAEMTSPANGSQIQSEATFSWSTGTGNVEYWIYAGTYPGGYNIHTLPQGTNTSATLNELPAGTNYIRLWSRCGATGGWTFNDYSYLRNLPASVPAELGGNIAGPWMADWLLPWSPGSNCAEYMVHIGTSRGNYDIYRGSHGLNTQLSNLPAAWGNYPVIYFRLWSRFAATDEWAYNDYTFTHRNGSLGAGNEMWEPIPGATISSKTTFRGIMLDAVSCYYVGTARGAWDVATTCGQPGTQAVTLNDLPSGWIYVRLWTRKNGYWWFRDYKYFVKSPEPAEMTSPVGGSQIQPTTTFTWSKGWDVTEYWLYVGTTIGRSDLYAGNEGTSTSKTLSNLPDGVIYGRLWSRLTTTAEWAYKDYVFINGNAACTPAQMTSPTAGSPFFATTTFTWNQGVGNDQYELDIGSSEAGSDLYYAIQGTDTSRTLSFTDLQSGQIYARLWSHCTSTGQWARVDYVYPMDDCKPAELIDPDDKAFIPASATFRWTTGSDNDQYWLHLGSAPGSFDYLTENLRTKTQKIFHKLPNDKLYLRLWSHCRRTERWNYKDYSFFGLSR